MELRERVALVTGAGQGIGRAIALKLVAEGATLVINDISPSAEKVAGDIKAGGGHAIAILADVSSADDVSKMIEQIISQYGRIDILVNNAGITRDSLAMRMSEEDWDKVLTINLKSVFLCTRAVVKNMLKQRSGRIISIASIIGLIGNPGQTNYASAKAGIIGFTKSIAKEVASRGITANAVAPGFIDTEMTKSLSDSQRQEYIKNIPLGRLGTPEDIAEAVAFLASPGAGYISGQVLTVDGGMTMV